MRNENNLNFSSKKNSFYKKSLFYFYNGIYFSILNINEIFNKMATLKNLSLARIPSQAPTENIPFPLCNMVEYRNQCFQLENREGQFACLMNREFLEDAKLLISNENQRNIIRILENPFLLSSINNKYELFRYAVDWGIIPIFQFFTPENIDQENREQVIYHIISNLTDVDHNIIFPLFDYLLKNGKISLQDIHEYEDNEEQTLTETIIYVRQELYFTGEGTTIDLDLLKYLQKIGLNEWAQIDQLEEEVETIFYSLVSNKKEVIEYLYDIGIEREEILQNALNVAPGGEKGKYVSSEGVITDEADYWFDFVIRKIPHQINSQLAGFFFDNNFERIVNSPETFKLMEKIKILISHLINPKDFYPQLLSISILYAYYHNDYQLLQYLFDLGVDIKSYINIISNRVNYSFTEPVFDFIESVKNRMMRGMKISDLSHPLPPPIPQSPSLPSVPSVPVLTQCISQPPFSPTGLPDISQLHLQPSIDPIKLANSIGRSGYLLEELKNFCRQFHLPVSGSKAQLVERLQNYIK